MGDCFSSEGHFAALFAQVQFCAFVCCCQAWTWSHAVNSEKTSVMYASSEAYRSKCRAFLLLTRLKKRLCNFSCGGFDSVTYSLQLETCPLQLDCILQDVVQWILFAVLH